MQRKVALPAALVAALRDRVVLRGQFTLRSGRKSEYYLDKYRFCTDPSLLEPLAAAMAECVPPGTTRLAGAELGAVPLVTAVALKTGLPTILIRNAKKGYGTERRLEGAVDPGDTVVLIEDICTTGGQVIEAAQVLAEAGVSLTLVLCAIDRLEGARQLIEASGLPFLPILTRDDLLAPPR